MTQLVGGIEAGGTKFVCAVGTGPEDIRAEVRFPTTTPEETIGRALEFFRPYLQGADALAAVGIASFGPVDLRPDSPTFGHITTTPKEGWSNVDFAGSVERELARPVAFDTDVNAAAVAEWRWGAAAGLSTFIYLTIGTGIGGGGLVNGRPMRGLVHPEMGHLRIPHDTARDPYPGRCPFHGDCLEGLASGPAIEERWGEAADRLPPEHPAWPLEAEYLAHGLVNLICTLSPERILMGGGVMAGKHLFDLLRPRVQQLLAGYVQSPDLLDSIDRYILPPALGPRAGVLGAIALALAALETD
jgi:fructokinase